MHLLRTALIAALLPVMAPAAVTPADGHSTDRSWTSAGDENDFHLGHNPANPKYPANRGSFLENDHFPVYAEIRMPDL
jgi:hypothetical protein